MRNDDKQIESVICVFTIKWYNLLYVYLKNTDIKYIVEVIHIKRHGTLNFKAGLHQAKSPPLTINVIITKAQGRLWALQCKKS